MGTYSISLFGKFDICCGERTAGDIEAQKVQELFFYLLIYRARPHLREKLAALLWEDSSITTAKRYLRQALWKLQSQLDELKGNAHSLLLVDSKWVQINDQAALWLDVGEFEHAYMQVQNVPGRQLTDLQVDALQKAVALYRGDLLEDWYQDWCIFERERFQNMYLIMLDKLINYNETQQQYEMGIFYGTKVLQIDRARERTHRQLMRLYFLSKDRTGALRQYERCRAALADELDVQPTHHTEALYHQIFHDLPLNSASTSPDVIPTINAAPQSLPEVLDCLNQLKHALANVQNQLEQNINAVKTAMMDA